MEASKEKTAEEVLRNFRREPFDFGIKELKRVLSRMDMPKSEKNRTIRLYKERLYTRVAEVKAKMEEKLQLPEDDSEAIEQMLDLMTKEDGSVGETNGVRNEHATDK